MDLEITSGGVSAGPGTDWKVDRDLAGLGMPKLRTADVDHSDRDGGVAGRDLFERRTLRWSMTTRQDTAQDALDVYDELEAAWRRSNVDVELEITLAERTRTFFGRFRGLEPDLSLLAGGRIGVLVTFEALDPLAYGDADIVDAGSSISVVVAGEPTARATLTIVGNGGTPVVTNADDLNGSIAWSTPLATSDIRVIDLAAMTVVDDAGTDYGSEVSSGSTWFVLQPGSNAVAVTGAASVAAAFRPAYLT